MPFLLPQLTTRHRDQPIPLDLITCLNVYGVVPYTTQVTTALLGFTTSCTLSNPRQQNLAQLQEFSDDLETTTALINEREEAIRRLEVGPTVTVSS